MGNLNRNTHACTLISLKLSKKLIRLSLDSHDLNVFRYSIGRLDNYISYELNLSKRVVYESDWLEFLNYQIRLFMSSSFLNI